MFVTQYTSYLLYLHFFYSRWWLIHYNSYNITVTNFLKASIPTWRVCIEIFLNYKTNMGKFRPIFHSKCHPKTSLGTEYLKPLSAFHAIITIHPCCFNLDHNPWKLFWKGYIVLSYKWQSIIWHLKIMFMHFFSVTFIL